MAVLYTVGHSTRTLPELIDILREAEVAQVADVRFIPRSGRHPQFNIDTLPASLAESGLHYRHLPALTDGAVPQRDGTIAYPDSRSRDLLPWDDRP